MVEARIDQTDVHGELLNAEPQQPLHLDRSFPSQTVISDVAVTASGTVLVAATTKGLFEYSPDGTVISNWRPSELNTRAADERAELDPELDGVQCVAVVSNGRVAVSLELSRNVAVLQKCETPDVQWSVLRLLVLTESCDAAWKMASSGDALAAVLSRSSGFAPSKRLLVLSLSSGLVVSPQTRSYAVGALAISDQALFTAGSHRPPSASGQPPWATLEAFTLDGQKRLWCHTDESVVQFTGLCVSDDGGLVYIGMLEARAKSRSWIATIRAQDGRILRNSGALFDGASGRSSILSGATDGRRTLLALADQHYNVWLLSVEPPPLASAAAADKRAHSDSATAGDADRSSLRSAAIATLERRLRK